MKIISEICLADFEGWSGAEDVLARLDNKEIETLECLLEDLYPDGIDETQLNDILRFDTDWIAEVLGYKSADHLLGYETDEDILKEEFFDAVSEGYSYVPDNVINEFINEELDTELSLEENLDKFDEWLQERDQDVDEDDEEED